jgi:hypothetical protein
MVFLMADRLRRHLSGEFSLPEDIKVACIESLVIHVRSLEEFIRGSPQDEHPRDALASDFFADGEWEQTRKRIQNSSLRKVAQRAGREVAQLSYRRLGMTEEARLWQFDVIVCVIGNALRLFLDGADRQDLRGGFEMHLREVWPEHLNFPSAIGFPPNCDTAPAVTIATHPFDDLTISGRRRSRRCSTLRSLRWPRVLGHRGARLSRRHCAHRARDCLTRKAAVSGGVPGRLHDGYSTCGAPRGCFPGPPPSPATLRPDKAEPSCGCSRLP